MTPRGAARVAGVLAAVVLLCNALYGCSADLADPATSEPAPTPPDGRFHATVQTVPASVHARSSWTNGCPVAAADLRYLTVSFRGFDGLAHTGELLVNARAAIDLVTVFHRLSPPAFR